jgi:hypothetical protein
VRLKCLQGMKIFIGLRRTVNNTNSESIYATLVATPGMPNTTTSRSDLPAANIN